MLMMEIGKVVQDLNNRFATPLPEFHNRRIIFWYDEDREFEDKLDNIQLDNAQLIRLTGTNSFAAKKLLTVDDTTGNYLVYCPLSYDKPDDNWLINIELYSGEPFRADLNTIWMDEMGLPASQVLHNQVKKYHKFFNAKERRSRFAAFSDNVTTPTQMHLAVMAAICGLKDTQPGGIIRAVLEGGSEPNDNPIYQSLVNYNAHIPFWVMVAQASGYKGGDEPNLGALACHIFLTAASRTIRPESLGGLERYISVPHQSWCYDFISDWIRADDVSKLYDIARTVEDETRLYQRFSNLEVADLADTECFPCVNEVILKKLMTEISNHIIQTDVIQKVVEKRRSKVWYDDISCYYDGLSQLANMQAFFQEHSAGFHTVEPVKIWNEYTTEYYKMDTYYRLFHLCFQKSLKKSNSLLDDLFKQVADCTEGLYSNWYLVQLGENWATACADEFEKNGSISELSRQEYFYDRKVKNADSRVFVIISDALRYEVAAALADQLRRETQSKVELESMCGIFPTITPYGMAALLPHKKLTVQPKNGSGLAVLADDQPTDAGNRGKVLQNYNKNSVALQYKNIVGMKRADRSALVKGMEVVYIYHDKIDEAAHTSDSSVFPACNEAIEEIKNMVRIIVNEFSGAHICITADHGFLYTYQPLTEDSKVDSKEWKDQAADYGRRYAILNRGVKSAYLQPIRFLDGSTDYDAFAPKENIRIKMSGGGMNYVHGGSSLQEMCVPLINYTYLRNDSKEYKRNKCMYDTKPVTVSLLSANRKISNMIFSLNFYQKEAVSSNREAATYQVYFTDSAGKVVSDTVKIIADKASENAQERTFRCNFNLKSLQFDSKETYYLVIADESGLQMPVREEFQIDIAFAVDEFNFFG